MKLYRIQIDHENNAEEYWTNDAQRIWNSFECLRDKIFGGLYFTRRSEAEHALNKMRSLPNWSSNDYPEHAPNPIVDEIFVDEIDDDERLNDLIDEAVELYVSKVWRIYHNDSIAKNLVMNEIGEIDSLFNWPPNFQNIKYFYICEVDLNGLDPEGDAANVETFDEFLQTTKSMVRDWIADDVERAFDEWSEWIESEDGGDME